MHYRMGCDAFLVLGAQALVWPAPTQHRKMPRPLLDGTAAFEILSALPARALNTEKFIVYGGKDF